MRPWRPGWLGFLARTVLGASPILAAGALLSMAGQAGYGMFVVMSQRNARRLRQMTFDRLLHAAPNALGRQSQGEMQQGIGEAGVVHAPWMGLGGWQQGADSFPEPSRSLAAIPGAGACPSLLNSRYGSSSWKKASGASEAGKCPTSFI